MARHSVDLRNVDAAFQHLADNDEGNAALKELSEGLSAVAAQTSDLNDDELHYLLVHLVNQREDGPATNDEVFTTADSRLASGFTILRAVPAETTLALSRG